MQYVDGVLDYQKITLEKLICMAEITELEGKVILEIGGSGNMAVAKSLSLETGVKVVVVTPNPELHSPDVLEGTNVELVIQPAESSGLGNSVFDIIYGGAVLEHINNLTSFFVECYRMVKPGGWVLLNGGPHWSGPIGHHLFLKTKSQKLYTFNGDNPIPDYAHLYLKQNELELLLEKVVSLSDSKEIAQQVYLSTDINRHDLSYILNCVWLSPWYRAIIDYCGPAPSIDIMRKIDDSGKKTNPVGPDNIYLALKK